MIVKLIIHQKLDVISIWSKEGDRLYWSDKTADIKTATDLLTVNKKLTDRQIAAQALGEKVILETELRMHGYFNAYWKNKIVQLCKRASGYEW